MKKISVIITTYNRGKMLENAILSVLNQTYKNLELIIVDDNFSNPKMREITRSIVKKYNNIILVENKENLGGALSRNEGIKIATGELISFLDDDDIYLPNRIEKLCNIFNQHENENVGLVYCSCYIYNSKGDITGEWINCFNGKPFYQHMINCIASTSMWLASKDALIKVGMFDQSPCKQDSIVILKLFNNGYNVYGTSEKLVLYFVHGGTGISGLKMKNIEGINIFRELCRKSYNNLSVSQIINVENNFHFQIMKIYKNNKKNKLALKELFSIYKNGLFNKYSIIASIKFVFPFIVYSNRFKYLRKEKINPIYLLNID